MRASLILFQTFVSFIPFVVVVVLNFALFGALIFYAWDSCRNLNSFRNKRSLH